MESMNILQKTDMQELEIVREKIQNHYRVVRTDEDLEWNRAIDLCTNIINAHLSHENDPEIKRSSRDNDGWIPVEDRLPEDDIEVLITYADVDNENETGIDITTYGYATLGGNKLGYKEWRNPFPYFKGNYKVVAWRPLPEPYRPERNGE